jgi:hypothetical protein
VWNAKDWTLRKEREKVIRSKRQIYPEGILLRLGSISSTFLRDFFARIELEAIFWENGVWRIANSVWQTAKNAWQKPNNFQQILTKFLLQLSWRN